MSNLTRFNVALEQRLSKWEQVQVTLTMLAVLLVVLILMLGATWINRIIGNSGASIVSRVMGLILASVATTNTLAGMKEYFANSLTYEYCSSVHEPFCYE